MNVQSSMIKKYILIISSLVFIASCSNKPDVEITASDDKSLKTNEVFIVNHGWHTGFVISARSIYTYLPELKSRFGETSYIEFGWGDKGFYQAKEITAGLVLKAILWPTETVVHTVSVPLIPSVYFKNSEVIKICLSKNEHTGLVKFITNSFMNNKKNEVISLDKGIYGNSQFYRGMGDYYLFNTCNKWTAKGLASAGIDISTSFKLTASSIMDHLYALQAHSISSDYSCNK